MTCSQDELSHPVDFNVCVKLQSILYPTLGIYMLWLLFSTKQKNLQWQPIVGGAITSYYNAIMAPPGLCKLARVGISAAGM